MHSQNPIVRLVLCSDTRPTKFALFVGALFWAAGLAVPGDTMTRQSFAVMGDIANEKTWTALWSLYAVGMLWKTFRHVHISIASIINILGLALWGTFVLAILLQASWPWPAGLASDGVMLLLAFWVLIRTGADGGDRRGD